MNVDKWVECGKFLLINGPGAVIVLYWASVGSCYYILCKLGFGYSPRTKETLSDFS